ncbi:MAG TPA: nitroreductase family deazaflavin-dependent oxidoreductase [Pseudonocardiaceae bacterium]|jgi:deazaflavin-dependent oxidoreductase (nitroreductase family)|nr:nitroreductase family deazaflavin-dependent oxidoreductase [Pseudonocardiaceae bacterium]
MVAPRAIARFNRRVTNRVLPFGVLHLPGFALIVHTGRKSGKTYRTPVNMFRTDTGYRIALTYGPESDWVRNVLAAGGCDAVVRGTVIHLTGPVIRHDPKRGGMPAVARPVLAAVGVSDFLDLESAG